MWSRYDWMRISIIWYKIDVLIKRAIFVAYALNAIFSISNKLIYRLNILRKRRRYTI